MIHRVGRACWLSVLAVCAVLQAMTAAAQISPGLLALRPIKGVSYQPSPSDDCQLQTQITPSPCASTPTPGYNPVYYDTDFYNTDFALLWGPGTTTTPGRNDLHTMKTQGINFLHLYNWDPGRDHSTFLSAVAEKSMKIMVPISNYTNCLIVGGCQGVGAGSYQAAYNNIQNIFNQVYGGGTTPNDAVGMWGIFNEYDYWNIDPANIAFVVQAILQLEATAGVTGANRLPFAFPVSNAVNAGSSLAWFANAQAVYQAIPGANASIPPGVLANVALSMALQSAHDNQTTTYGGVTVAAMPADFWTTRVIAAVNPFTSGPTINAYITSSSQFQSAFPAAAVAIATPITFTWKATWNALPPLFFSEMGINIGGSGGTAQTQAAWLLTQLQCTNPWAIDATSTTNGYFIGSNVFEFEYEGVNGRWGMFVFPNPLSYTTATTTSGGSYRVDTLNAQPAWTSVLTGFQATQKTCS